MTLLCFLLGLFMSLGVVLAAIRLLQSSSLVLRFLAFFFSFRVR